MKKYFNVTLRKEDGGVIQKGVVATDVVDLVSKLTAFFNGNTTVVLPGALIGFNAHGAIDIE
jgi:hypothetical protein